MMEYCCPACNPDEDIQNLYDERADGTTYIQWGGCGHYFRLGGRTKRDIQKQRSEQSQKKRKDSYMF